MSRIPVIPGAPGTVPDPKPAPATVPAPAAPAATPPAPAATPSPPPVPKGYWDTAVPDDGLPDVYKPFSGKTPTEIASSHRELRQLSGTQGARIKDLETNLSTAQEALQAAQDGGVATEDQLRLAETRQMWRDSVSAYYVHKGSNVEMIDKLVERTGLSQQDILDVHEQFLIRRNGFLAKAKESHPDVDMNALETFLTGDDSPFSEGMVEALYVLADEGYTGWIEMAQKKYDGFLKDGGKVAGRPAEAHELSRGRPPTSDSAGYKSRDEYQKDYLVAVNSGDLVEKARVLEKLEGTDKSKW